MGLSKSTPIPCRCCDLMRPLWHRIAGAVLPGKRCKCIRLGGICEKIQERDFEPVGERWARRRE